MEDEEGEEEEEEGGGGVGGGRQLHLSFVSFQQEKERVNFFRQSWQTRKREREGRQSRHSKRERGRAIRKEKRGKESCLP